ncbi:uncharacterized protein DDB_G0282077-like isoform X1 [Watersipora subatra]|uniref:uncharacterized protein DDB_G0282077-like isoform X1 n=1 Tax=Watersipora subatra TaxID=2589382 RepID=UPI00355C270B
MMKFLVALMSFCLAFLQITANGFHGSNSFSNFGVKCSNSMGATSERSQRAGKEGYVRRADQSIGGAGQGVEVRASQSQFGSQSGQRLEQESSLGHEKRASPRFEREVSGGFGSRSGQRVGKGSSQGHGGSASQGFSGGASAGFRSQSGQRVGQVSGLGHEGRANPRFEEGANGGFGSQSGQRVGQRSGQGHEGRGSFRFEEGANGGFGSQSSQRFGQGSGQGFGVKSGKVSTRY